MKVRSLRARTVIALLAVVCPWRIRRSLYRRLLGYNVHPTARIGRSLIDVESFEAGPHASVASLTVVRGCESVTLEEDAAIGPLNWVNAVRRDSTEFLRSATTRRTELVLRRGSAITSMHFLDCCDRIELGEYATLGGAWTQVLTHYLDHHTGKQTAAPVTVGAFSIVSSSCLVLAGAEVGERCIVAGGAVLTAGKYMPNTLHAGVPAVAKSALDPDLPPFTRTERLMR